MARRAGSRPHLNGREIEAMLIDAGGVLLDPNWRTVADVLARRGVKVHPSDLAAADPVLRREIDDADLVRSSTDVVRRERWLSRLLRHAGVGAEPDVIEAAGDEIDALHRQRGLWEVVQPGAGEALNALRRAGLRLALASNAEPLLRSKMSDLGLADRFDHLAISGEVGVEKPDPRFFQGALAVLGVPPDRAVHVGDLYEIDVVGARAAGLEAILVDAADLSRDRDVVRVSALSDVPALIGAV
jgi:HAD superfamily hydrolase (TIGR01509 family)